MLKKAGIVVATAAAGLLAVSPLAFAGDDHKGRGHDKVKIEDINKLDDSSEGLINVSDNNVSVPVVACDNQVPVNVLGVQVPVNDTEVIADLTGALGLGLLGSGEAEAKDKGTNIIDDSCSAAAKSGDNIELEND